MRRRLPLTALVLVAGASRLHAGARVPPVASYEIHASYDAEKKTITAKGRVTLVNRTSRPVSELRLHLYLNAFRNERSTWMRRRGADGERGGRGPRGEAGFGYVEISRIELGGEPARTDLTPGLRFVAPDDGNADDRTLAAVPLPRPVAPGASLVFTVDFVSKFPRAIARTGVKGDFLLAAQWFPKLAVLSDGGWVARQFHASTEFFADFGDYDVTLELPRELKEKVGATGVQTEAVDLSGGRSRVRFVAEDVHDFAWTVSPAYEVHHDTFTHAGLPNVDLILLLQPDHRRVKERYFRAVKEALASYGTLYVAYPYPTLTVVDPPFRSNAGGMEYPNFITGGAPWLARKASHQPESVTVHEFGHQIFYGLLASNEVDEAHLDEGFNSYATARTLKSAYGDPSLLKSFFGLPVVFKSVKLPYPLWPNERYLDWQLSSRSDATLVPSFAQLDGAATRINAYSKTALLLASAERTIGEPAWGRILKTYATRFAFRHPTTADFLSVVREVAGDGAETLFRDAWGTAATYDYAVSVAESRRATESAGYFGDGDARKFSPGAAAPDAKAKPAIFESVAVVRRMGDGVWPVDVELVFEGGARVRRAWAGKDLWVRYRATGPRLVSVAVDPDRKLLLDPNVLDNARRVEPDRAPARALAHRLRSWAMNALELFALLG